MEYDAAAKVVLLFGGYDDAGYLNDTWTWDGVDWSQQSPSASPPVRAGAGIGYDLVTHQSSSPAPRQLPGRAFDRASGAIALFGGSSRGTLEQDTWTL
jgi:hypothetical protein